MGWVGYSLPEHKGVMYPLVVVGTVTLCCRIATSFPLRRGKAGIGVRERPSITLTFVSPVEGEDILSLDKSDGLTCSQFAVVRLSKDACSADYFGGML